MTTLYIIGGIIVFLGFTAFFGAPYVPSRNAEIKRAFTKLYPLGKDDLLVDFGCGDGKVLRAATEFGAKSVGIELHPVLFLIARLRLRKNKRATVKFGDMFRMKLPKKTTVVYVFGVERDGERIFSHLEAEAERLGRDLTLISYATPAEKHRPDREFEAYYLYNIKTRAKRIN